MKRVPSRLNGLTPENHSKNKYANLFITTLEELLRKIDSLVVSNYFEDIPLEVFRVTKNPHGKGALVQLCADNYNRSKSELLSDQLNFDLIGFTNEKLAGTLVEKNKYLIFGKKYKRLSRDETYILVSQTYFSPDPEISKDLIYSDIYNFEVGVYLCEIDSVQALE